MKSKLDMGRGARIIERNAQKVYIKKEDWERNLLQGKKAWVSKRFGIFTDFEG